ncbi:ArsR family transcriptional regulator [Klebsiella pneumoniae]|uniref:ArsR family transcriptional regulator n=1 Tax=Klebsiella pneumoniae TaxID=573 RepID=UPI001F2C23DF|nr:ArsR family transcriptional regulator [Klebsiella pneumoniae]MCE7415591.1 ArsR family transcriptional regulator [Klebsiella pneumoniae]
MTKIKYINTDVFKYVPIEDAFNECTRITNLKTGVTESLSPADKQFYVRMRHRYYLFAIELGGTYYDDIDQLGASIGVSSATATRIVAKLKKIGLIVSNKPKRSNQWTITPLTPENFIFERDRNAMERDTPPEWVDCLKHPVFGKAKEDVAPEAGEEKHQSVPEEAKAEPKPDKPKPTKKPASIPAKEIKIEAVNPVSIGLYRDEWENSDKNLPVSQHPKIRWLLINGYLDTEKNPKLKTIYEEIKHLC